MSESIEKSAEISPCGLYRHSLARWWGKGKRLGFVMLNPSTADGRVDDRTIRRCIGFAKREKFDGIEVRNLFQFRAPDPAAMMEAPDPLGPRADEFLLQLKNCPLIVAAWGNEGIFMGRAAEARRLLSGMFALKINASGEPGHPLYLRRNAPLIPLGGNSAWPD